MEEGMHINVRVVPDLKHNFTTLDLEDIRLRGSLAPDRHTDTLGTWFSTSMANCLGIVSHLRRGMRDRIEGNAGLVLFSSLA